MPTSSERPACAAVARKLFSGRCLETHFTTRFSGRAAVGQKKKKFTSISGCLLLRVLIHQRQASTDHAPCRQLPTPQVNSRLDVLSVLPRLLCFRKKIKFGSTSHSCPFYPPPQRPQQMNAQPERPGRRCRGQRRARPPDHPRPTGGGVREGSRASRAPLPHRGQEEAGRARCFFIPAGGGGGGRGRGRGSRRRRWQRFGGAVSVACLCSAAEAKCVSCMCKTGV